MAARGILHAVAGRDLRLPARRHRPPAVQHVRAVDVRLGAGAAVGRAALHPLLRCQRARGRGDAARGDGSLGLALSHRRSLRRRVRSPPGLRDDVPEPANHAAHPAHSDEGKGLRSDLRRAGTVAGASGQ